MNIKKFIIIFLLMICFVNKAKAESFYEGSKIEGMYVVKINDKGERKEKQGNFIRRTSDNFFVYCLEPFVKLNTNMDYEEYMDEYEKILKITEEEWQKIELISYYGYMYKHHVEDYWYYITQILIWREVDKDSKFYFINELGGEIDYQKYEKEIEEIYDLVDNHFKNPVFDKLELMYGEQKTFKDYNNVLDNFKIENNNVKIENNALNINGDKLGKYNISLEKASNKYSSKTIVYINPTSQNIMAVGNFETIIYNLEYEVKETCLKIIKIDSETNNPIKQEGIIFEIYNLDNELITVEKTDKNGEILLNNLKIGKYYIKEKTNQIIDGYTINETIKYFELKSEEPVIIYFENEPLKGNIEIIKKDEEGNFVENVKFGLYDEHNNLIDEKYTNISGYLIFENLKVGKYVIRELETKNEYVKNIKEYEIYLEIDNKNNKIINKELEIINNYKKGTIIIKKVDINNEQLEKAKFVLYNSNYEEVASGITAQNGEIRIENLKIGKYYLKEVEAPIGYQCLKDYIEFEIKENNEIVTINVTNYKISIMVPNTGLAIKKYEFIIPNKKFLFGYK